jgi:subtilisin family serine protease
MRSFRKSGRKLSLLVVILTMLAGSASAFGQTSQSTNFTAAPLSPSDQATLAVVKNDAAQPQLQAARSAAPAPKRVGVIVKLKDASLATYKGDVPGLAATSPVVTGAEKIDTQSANSKQYLGYLSAQQDAFVASAQQAIPSASSTQRLNVVVNAVAMQVPSDQVSTLRALPGVAAVYPDVLVHADTDRSPAFIGAPKIWRALGGQSRAGDNVIVGIIDTGIWPEHPSFSDPDPSGKPYGPAPAKWKGTHCDFGAPNVANNDAPFTCNNKLLGAQAFLATYGALIGFEDAEFSSARDSEGHGTHTAGTSAGNANVAAAIFGVSRGTISGIAPRARVVAYKALGAQGGFSSDLAAAVQQAIADGVDVINYSISGGENPYSDAVELAFLDAYAAGVFVATSAGNSGPGPDTVAHRSPWVTTVAASTTDRAFKNTLTVNGAGGSTLILNGTSLTGGISTPLPVVAPVDPFCTGPYAPGTFTGQIVLCQRGGPAGQGRVQKGYNVLQGNAAGMILFNTSAAVTDQETDNHFLPTTHIQYSEGQQVLAFLAANPGATATLTAGVKSTQQGDVMASFSSRGGPGQTLGVSKPDITGPGVQILAGHTPASIDIATGPQGELFQAIAGTSMSSPHIAGAGALLKAQHPTWTPGQIRSALMTTAWTKVVKEDGITPADPFDFGSGRVDLNVAGNPGFTFDATAADYVTHQNDLWNVNYPSVYVPVMPGIITVKRTAREVSHKNTFYKVIVTAPSDVKITTLKELDLLANKTNTFDITIDASKVPIGEIRFAMLTFRQLYETTSHRELHIPITIQRQQPVVTLAKSCAPVSFPKGSTADCTITMQNTTFGPATFSMTDRLPNELKLVKNSVVNGTGSGNTVSANGTLAGAQAPIIGAVAGSSPFGYVPLSSFGIGAVGGVGDETIANFNVPGFKYAGQTYTRIGVVSNGYAVVGGGTAADVDYINQSLPDVAAPNNVLAPFWTDLNPAAGGAIRVAILSALPDRWLVIEWDAVKEYSTAATTTAQIWIHLDAVEDVTFTYGALGGTGDGGFLTIGAENYAGSSGQNYYLDGTGGPLGGDVQVTAAPGVPGETRVVSFKATGAKAGGFTNYAKLRSDLFQGINVASFSGTVTP